MLFSYVIQSLIKTLPDLVKLFLTGSREKKEIRAWSLNNLQLELSSICLIRKVTEPSSTIMMGPDDEFEESKMQKNLPH